MPKKIQKKKKNKTEPRVQETRPKDFLDLIAPAAVKFNTDHYICGSMYHCTLALRSYPATTEELALLRHLGEKSGVTLSIYTRQVTAAEENGILHNAENKNRMARSSTNSMKAAVTAEGNLQDVAELIAAMRKNREPLVHCAVYIDLAARDPESLRRLREEVTAELVRSKLGTDQLLLRQQDGFLSSNPMGRNTFRSQYERVMPPARWPIYTPSTTPARPIPTDSTLGGTATAPTSSWIWTGGRRTRPPPAPSSWATLARARAIS